MPFESGPFFTQIPGSNFLHELCREVHPETVPLQAVRCALRCADQRAHFSRGRKGREKGRKRKGVKGNVCRKRGASGQDKMQYIKYLHCQVDFDQTNLHLRSWDSSCLLLPCLPVCAYIVCLFDPWALPLKRIQEAQWQKKRQGYDRHNQKPQGPCRVKNTTVILIHYGCGNKKRNDGSRTLRQGL